ncbi:heme exporter protein CcmD [Thalassotalea sp. ND16A]|uniref:heme exporter protein CcmD n=1 Tax=Thalassotalea sp. ND16A TaxID=1535422 RepID=UPI000519FE97|nr:heme exporter protein CcmD [Thalassotalea sp. ND16A]KGK00558.1 heme exporter protein D (CcmD) [Thalassotalea sp. ND16A]
MAFDSLREFFNMGGYAFYVWLSYGFSALVLIILAINSNGMEKQIFQQIKQRLKREEKLKQAALRRKEGK